MNDLVAAIVLDRTQQYACLPDYKKSVAAFLLKHDIQLKATPPAHRPSEMRFALIYHVRRQALDILDQFQLRFDVSQDARTRAHAFFQIYKACFYCMKPQLDLCYERLHRRFYDSERESLYLVKDIYCYGDIAYDRGVISEDECKRYKTMVEHQFRAEQYPKAASRSSK